MKKLVLWGLAGFMAVGAAGASGDSKKSDKMVKRCLPVIQQLAAEKTVVSDTVDQNAHPLNADAAQKLQEDWEEIGIADSVKPYLNKPSCATIKAYKDKLPTAVKFFTLDAQGNVVATVPKSKDFIHATEEKFVKCYNGGNGKVFVDKAKLDVSTKIYSVQVAAPIQDGGKTVGVLVVTLSLE